MLAIDLNSGERSIVADANTGSNVNFRPSGSIMFDARDNRIFVDDSDLREIIVIDLATSERAISARGNRRLELND